MTKKYVLASINIILLIILTIIYSIGLFTIEIYNNNKNIIIVISLALLAILSLVSYFHRKISIYNIGTFITFILNIALVYNIYSLNNDYQYIQNLFNQDYKYITYNIYVLKSTPKYNNLTSLSNKKIGLLNDNAENIKEHLNTNTNINYYQYNSIYELEYAIKNGEIQSIILSEKQYSSINTEEISLKKETRSIYKTKIKDAI